MKNRERGKKGTKDSGNPARLGMVVVGAAVVITFFVIYSQPTRQMAPDSTKPISIRKPNVESSSIELPSTGVEVTSEELRGELLQLGQDLLAKFPRVPEAMHVVALLYADLQKATEAEKIWRKCIELAPRQPGPYVGLATAAMDLGNDEEAVEILRTAISVGCSTSDVHHQLAAALAKLGRLDEAAAAIQKGLETFPQSPENWLQLGQVQIQLSQFSAAERSLSRAVDGGLTSESVYFALAAACAGQDKNELAARYREEFHRRKTEGASLANEPFQVRYDRAMRRVAAESMTRAGAVYDRHGLPDNAESLLVRACSVDPQYAVACAELAGFLRRQQRMADAQRVRHRLLEIDLRNGPR